MIEICLEYIRVLLTYKIKVKEDILTAILTLILKEK